MTVIFHIEGGLGKHIMATALLKVIKKNHPKDTIHVVCAYPDVFKHNPAADHVHQNGQHGSKNMLGQMKYLAPKLVTQKMVVMQ